MKVDMAEGSSVGRAGRGMAVATLASRATGFVRLVVLASTLGLGSRLLDCYNAANTLPNAVYELVVGGAMASVVVPLLARAALTEPDDGVVYAQRLLSLMVHGLGAVTVVAMVSAPWLVQVYTPGSPVSSGSWRSCSAGSSCRRSCSTVSAPPPVPCSTSGAGSPPRCGRRWSTA